MAPLREKIGYGFGDMASSMFWKVFSYYLPFFYSNVFGLRLVDAAFLVLVTRIWDALSDPMMGIIADRTHTRWGKYRPYLLWVAAPFSICGILLFSTPDWDYAGKMVWAYVTYILMMTVYTGINVPYGAMLGVLSESPREKTVFSSYRMFFAYGGSFIALAAWQPLCDWFQSSFGASPQSSWQWAMTVIASACFVLFICCFLLTSEKIVTSGGFWLMLVLQVVISMLTGVMSPLIWSMYADVSDYSELKNNTASTGLIFSSSSMARNSEGQSAARPCSGCSTPAAT